MYTKRNIEVNVDFKLVFKSKVPDVVVRADQISYPPEPTFRYLEVPIEVLSQNRINQPIIDQIQLLKTISEKIETAEPYISFIYTFRSIEFLFKLDDELKSSNLDADTGKNDLNLFRANFRELFQPILVKLAEITNFASSTIQFIFDIIINPNIEYCEPFFMKLTEFLYQIFTIEKLKTLKTGISRDIQFCKGDSSLDQATLSKLSEIQTYFSGRNLFLNAIRTLVGEDNQRRGAKTKSQSLYFFTRYLQYCINRYKEQAVFPSERISLIIGMIFTLYVHGTNNPLNNIFQQSLCKDALDIIAQNAVLPLYVETFLIPGAVLADCRGLNAIKQLPFPTTQPELAKLSDQFLLAGKLSEIRSRYRDALKKASNMRSDRNKTTISNVNSVIDCLSYLVMVILQQTAFKFAVTGNPPPDHPSEETVYKYDLAVRFNYSEADINSLVETLAYVKSLVSNLIDAEPVLNAFLGQYLNDNIREFMDEIIEEPLKHASEVGDDDCVALLKSIHTIFYWPQTKAFMAPQHIDVLRVQFQSMILTNSKFLEKTTTFSQSHFKKNHVKTIEKFIQESSTWYNYFNFTSKVRKESNLGCLWFHETMLDVDHIYQFPIRSSLPFILVGHLLSTREQPALQDLVFFPFEIYNDASSQALNVYHSQHLFTEIAEETQVVVEMISFTFADTYYKMIRETSAAIEMKPNDIGFLKPKPMRFSIMALQNKLEIIGAPVDFNMIVVTKLNKRIREELEKYIKILTDFRMVPYVEHLVRIAKVTHNLLIENKVNIDDFDEMWMSAKSSDSPFAVSSKIQSCIDGIIDFSHMKLDYVNNCFIFSKPLTIDPLSKEAWAESFAKMHKEEEVHSVPDSFICLCRLFNYNELTILIQRSLSKLEDAALSAISSYNEFNGTIRIVPALARHDLVGFYDFNMDVYSAASHSHIGKFFASMRIVGNIIKFIANLDAALPHQTTGSLIPGMMKILKNIIISRKNSFYRDEFLDIESVTSLNNFSALWSVIEFIFCSPKVFYLSESNPAILLLDTFGDGPIVAAHAFISLCNHQSHYEYTSICLHALKLSEISNERIEKADLEKFLQNTAKIDFIRQFTNGLAGPFKINPDEL
ncbi:hypothetical protein TVAG_244910 [Trichomonas vaginalis G3]|uniref:CYRIA/CYRIB Rac1 binding domain-containing protein n=1 Tax=Trichomonas vaginalis (strain ATCC PRA-98 / G3) TaxID=412133 RepID=A2EMR3_TRIV3|nr:cytoplasmic FMR1-interacting protein-related family [Trichomonas vaginalis G3]EAY06059.1 hypothetical protein TVAG_244910 [Trichomonas vaginalis G3]KAI5536573.1 cytoplasmic FMR1-interacting protein-related family [Trichomonas vaginalis G3]|eukprot:XP_001318282.1 hypothetical protein [Trichomonas vaginalis G3]